MKILSVGSSYIPYKGGNAKRVSNMCENFCLIGHDVLVITNENKNEFDDKAYYLRTNVSVIRLKGVIPIILKLNKIIRLNKVDIVYTHNLRIWFICCLLLKKGPVLTSEIHALSKLKFYKEFILKVVLFKLKQKTKAIFVLSKNAKKILVHQYGFDESIIHFTPNGVDNKNIENLVFSKNTNFIFAYGGTLYEWQGIRILLSQAKEILNIGKDVLLKIIGGGPLYNEVKSFIENNNLSNKIELTGFVNEEDYINELKLVDVLLIPRPSSLPTETAIPLKIFDAIKANKPIIMSNVSGLTEVLTEDEALIYSHEETDKLIDCCKKIYRNERLAKEITLAAQKKIKTWPTNMEIAQLQIKIMETLVNKAN